MEEKQGVTDLEKSILIQIQELQDMGVSLSYIRSELDKRIPSKQLNEKLELLKKSIPLNEKNNPDYILMNRIIMGLEEFSESVT